jgi:hypothetical protein
MNDIEIRDVWPCSFVAPIKITSPNDDAIALTEVGGLRGVPWIGLADEDDEAGSRCCLHFDFEAIVDPCAAPSAVGAVQRILHDAPVPLTSPVTLRPPTGSMPAREDSAYLPMHDGRALGSDRGHRCHPRIRACSPSRQLRSRHHAPAVQQRGRRRTALSLSFIVAIACSWLCSEHCNRHPGRMRPLELTASLSACWHSEPSSAVGVAEP